MFDETTVDGQRKMRWRQVIDRQAWQMRTLAGTPGARYSAVRLRA